MKCAITTINKTIDSISQYNLTLAPINMEDIYKTSEAVINSTYWEVSNVVDNLIPNSFDFLNWWDTNNAISQ